MTQCWKDRLDARRKKGPSSFDKLRQSNDQGAFQKIVSGFRRPAQDPNWSKGYDSKGTW